MTAATPSPTMPVPYTKLDQDASARMLTDSLVAQVPFVFVRYGDGYLETIMGKTGMTCDHERYTPNLGVGVTRAWDTFMQALNCFAGDWLASSFTGPADPSIYEAEFRKLVGPYSPKWLHPECLLLMRESEALLDFYRAVRNDPRRKLLIGAQANYPAAKMLGADFIGVPMDRDLLTQVPRIVEQIERTPFDVLLWGAGMAGTVAAAQVFQRWPLRTYINLGSALDPLFRGRSRQGQLSRERARALFGEML